MGLVTGRETSAPVKGRGYLRLHQLTVSEVPWRGIEEVMRGCLRVVLPLDRWLATEGLSRYPVWQKQEEVCSHTRCLKSGKGDPSPCDSS